MPAIMNLCGHGTYRGADLDADFPVPECVEIHLYTAHAGFYDNAFEPYIRQGGDIQVERGALTRVRIEPRASKRQVPERLMSRFNDYAPEVIREGAMCKAYRLGFGWGLPYCFLEGGRNAIALAEWPVAEPRRIYFEWAEEYDVYVSTPGLQVSLKDFCDRVAGGDRLIIRWFACREDIVALDARGVFLPNSNMQRVLPAGHDTRPSFKTLGAELTRLETLFGAVVPVAPAHRCLQCPQTFRSRVLLTNHMTSAHPGS
jgi:hypothetical protein